MAVRRIPGAFGRCRLVRSFTKPEISVISKKGVIVAKNTPVKLTKGKVVPLWILALRVIWFVLSNILRVVVVPLGFIYGTCAVGVAHITKKLYDFK